MLRIRNNIKTSRYMCRYIYSFIILVIVFWNISAFNSKVYCKYDKTAQGGCILLDKNHSAIYISYEGIGEVEKYGKRNIQNFILRLRNNTNCPIEIETSKDATSCPTEGPVSVETITKGSDTYIISDFPGYGRVKEIITRTQNGELSSSEFPEYEDGVKLPVLYDVVHYFNYKQIINPGNYFPTGCISYYYTIPEGSSVLFDVRADYLQQQKDIAVSVNYTWDKTTYDYEAIHRVHFMFDSLPDEIMKKYNIRKRFSSTKKGS